LNESPGSQFDSEVKFEVPIETGVSQREISVQYKNLLWQVASLLAAPSLQDGFLTNAEVLEDTFSSTRLFGELNRGLWWQRTEESGEVPEGAILCPLVLYTDGTWLSKNGAHSTQPLVLTLGNFPRDIMNKKAAKRVREQQLNNN
jgi:hypothetical protein